MFKNNAKLLALLVLATPLVVQSSQETADQIPDELMPRFTGLMAHFPRPQKRGLVAITRHKEQFDSLRTLSINSAQMHRLMSVFLGQLQDLNALKYPTTGTQKKRKQFENELAKHQTVKDCLATKEKMDKVNSTTNGSGKTFSVPVMDAISEHIPDLHGVFEIWQDYKEQLGSKPLTHIHRNKSSDPGFILAKMFTTGSLFSSFSSGDAANFLKHIARYSQAEHTWAMQKSKETKLWMTTQITPVFEHLNTLSQEVDKTKTPAELKPKMEKYLSRYGAIVDVASSAQECYGNVQKFEDQTSGFCAAKLREDEQELDSVYGDFTQLIRDTAKKVAHLRTTFNGQPSEIKALLSGESQLLKILENWKAFLSESPKEETGHPSVSKLFDSINSQVDVDRQVALLTGNEEESTALMPELYTQLRDNICKQLSWTQGRCYKIVQDFYDDHAEQKPQQLEDLASQGPPPDVGEDFFKASAPPAAELKAS